jgi:hypothetical protein
MNRAEHYIAAETDLEAAQQLIIDGHEAPPIMVYLAMAEVHALLAIAGPRALAEQAAEVQS